MKWKEYVLLQKGIIEIPFVQKGNKKEPTSIQRVSLEEYLMVLRAGYNIFYVKNNTLYIKYKWYSQPTEYMTIANMLICSKRIWALRNRQKQKKEQENNQKK
jgi:hypothetical protein